MSRIGLAHECSYWARDDVQCPEGTSGRAARVGTLVHKLAEALVMNRNVQAEDVDLHELAEAKAIMDGPFRGWLGRHIFTHCEIGLRYDAENDVASIGPRRGEDGYDDHGPMVLKGTLDLLAVGYQSPDLSLWDIKTGQKKNVSIDQVYSQAVAATRAFCRAEAHVGFIFPMKTKCDESEREYLNPDRLDEEAGRIRRTLRLLPTSEPNPGPHCFKCPLGRAACPAYAAEREPIEPLFAF